MARFMLCLLLLVCMTLTNLGQTAGYEIPRDADVSVSEEVAVLKNGKKFHSTSVVAKDCSQVYDKATFDDNTSSNVIDDLDDELGVILLSTSPDRCFVRDIKGAKRKCVKGSNGLQKGLKAGEEDTQYEMGAEMKLDDLPERLRAVCEGRTVVKVHPVDSADQSRRKRYSGFYCRTIRDKCERCCHGWWIGKNCDTCCSEYSACVGIAGR